MAKRKSIAKIEKKLLVTGGTGFLGVHLVRQLLDAGEKNLRVMASSVPEWMKDAGVEAVEGSVTNTEDIANAVRGVSAIFHLAGKVSRDNSDAVFMNKIHVQGTRLLCEAAKEAGMKTIVLASSSGTIAVSEDDRFMMRPIRRRSRSFPVGPTTRRSTTRNAQLWTISTVMAAGSSL